MLVPETIDLGFELIGFLLFHHFHVTSCDALDFREARVAESVSTEANIGQRYILVKSLEKDRFDVFREEIVAKFHLLNVFVILESVDKENQACIIDSAG